MSRNKSLKSRFWAQADVPPYSISRQPVCTKQSDEEKQLFKGATLTGEILQSQPNRMEGWTVMKKKRSGGGKRPVNVNRDCTLDHGKMMTVDSHMLATAYNKDAKMVHSVTGISNQVGMDALTSFRQRKELFSKRHLEKFLTGKSPGVFGPETLTTKMKSATSRARVPHNTGFSSIIDDTTHGHSIDQSVGKLSENGGPLYKRLLSALIDENQDLCHLSDGNYSSSQSERSGPPRMQDWEKEFLGSVPEEDLLLKELHLIGIYPDKLPGLIEGDIGKDQDIQEPHMGINSKLASEAPFKNALVTQKSSRSKHTIHDFTGTAKGKFIDVYHQHTVLKVPLESDLYVDESWNTGKGRRLSGTMNLSSELSLPKGRVAANKKKKNRHAPHSAKRKRGMRGDDKSCHELTKSKKVTRSVPKDSLQKVKAASSHPLAERVIMGDSPIEGMDMISSRDELEDLSSLLDLDVDLLQDGGDNLSCLDIPMDDLSTLDFIF